MLGAHVTQKGSLVSAEHLRFDFSHPKPLSAEEIFEVENLVNAMIRRNEEVSTRLMTPDEAIEAGAMALFGEKYGEEVRVLAMGGDAKVRVAGIFPLNCAAARMCSGWVISACSYRSGNAIASGIRRIEALPARRLEFIAARDRILQATTDLLKVSADDVPSRVARLLDDRKKLDRELAEATKKLALAGGGDAARAQMTACANWRALNSCHARLTAAGQAIARACR